LKCVNDHKQRASSSCNTGPCIVTGSPAVGSICNYNSTPSLSHFAQWLLFIRLTRNENYYDINKALCASDRRPAWNRMYTTLPFKPVVSIRAEWTLKWLKLCYSVAGNCW
jgi:hypothetical protein